MTTISITLDDERFQRLRQAATTLGRSVEEMIHESIDEYLSKRQTFEKASDYVLQKNAELYRRIVN